MRWFSVFAWLFSSKKRKAADPARPAAGAVELGPKDEGELPDSDHLTLGLNLEGLREACELVGFPYMCYKDGFRDDAWKIKYKRKQANAAKRAAQETEAAACSSQSGPGLFRFFSTASRIAASHSCGTSERSATTPSSLSSIATAPESDAAIQQIQNDITDRACW